MSEIKNNQELNPKEVEKKSTEIMDRVSDGLQRVSSFSPDPTTRTVIKMGGKGLEIAANLKKHHDLKKAEENAKKREIANEIGNMAGASLGSGEKKTNF